MSRRVARVARHAWHWSADAFGHVSGLLTARRTPISARFSSTHARTTLRSFWTSTPPPRYAFGIASGTGGGCDGRHTHGIYGLARARGRTGRGADFRNRIGQRRTGRHAAAGMEVAMQAMAHRLPTGRSGRMPGLGSPLRIVRLGIRGALIGARAGTLPPQDASQPPAP